MKDNGRPQKDAGRTRETEISQIQRDQCAVDQHADERRTRPAGDAQSNQGNACHARYRNCDANKLLAQQQLRNERRNKQQPQSSSSFGDSSKNQYIFHRPVDLVAMQLPMTGTAWVCELNGES